MVGLFTTTIYPSIHAIFAASNIAKMAHQVDTDMMTGSSDSSSSQRQLSATSLNLIMEDNSLPQSEMTPTSHAFPISIMNGAPSSSSHSEISLTGQLSSSPTAEDTLPGSPSPTTATETKKTLDTFTDFPKFPAGEYSNLRV